LAVSHLDLTRLTDALATVLPLARPADQALASWFREHRDLGARDRAWLAERVYGVLRHLGQLRHASPASTPRALALAALVLNDGVSVRDLGSEIKSSEALWLAALKGDDRSTWPPHVLLDLPDWLHARLAAERSAQSLARLMRALNAPAPLDLRVNTLKASREAARSQLASEGISTSPTPWSPFGLRVEGKPHLPKSRVFADGWVEVQDEGSQLLALLVEPKRTDLVVDFCAGAGGKSLALGALMDSKGRLYAFDTSDRRLANLAPRLRRSGLSNVHARRIANENDLHIKRLSGKADRVLVDAPCTGLGTLRRNPDLKWRQTEASLAALIEKQRAILQAAARLVRPGGRLVYATCSVLTEENEAQVEGFLAVHPDFTLVDARTILARHAVALMQSGPLFVTDPCQHGTDAFFAAVLERRP
jgi:16S rRNA (cytosine967-C5)-methyltransferase